MSHWLPSSPIVFIKLNQKGNSIYVTLPIVSLSVFPSLRKDFAAVSISQDESWCSRPYTCNCIRAWKLISVQTQLCSQRELIHWKQEYFNIFWEWTAHSLFRQCEGKTGENWNLIQDWTCVSRHARHNYPTHFNNVCVTYCTNSLIPFWKQRLSKSMFCIWRLLTPTSVAAVSSLKRSWSLASVFW